MILEKVFMVKKKSKHTNETDTSMREDFLLVAATDVLVINRLV